MKDVEIKGLHGCYTEVGPSRDTVSVNSVSASDDMAWGFYTPAQARELAAALLQAADSTGSLDFGEVDRYRDAVAERVRADIAAFIRSNIDMRGRDFPDAESVAVWLEANR